MAISVCQRRREGEEGVAGADTAMRAKYNRQLHGTREAGAPEPLTTAFLKKFIKYAKNRYQCAPAPATSPLCLPARPVCLASCIPPPSVFQREHIWTLSVPMLTRGGFGVHTNISAAAVSNST